MCNTLKTASSNSEFLAGEISFSKILVKSQQSLRVKYTGFTFLQIKLSIIINNCHGLNIMCLKSNIASLPHIYPQSTVVTGSFRQRNYSTYPYVADFTDKKHVQNQTIQYPH